MGKKKVLKKKKPVKTKVSKPKKVPVNYLIFASEKEMLEAKARRYCRGNVTKLIRLVAHGKFQPVKEKAA